MKHPIQKWKGFRRKKRKKPQRKTIPPIMIPSFFTLMNLFSGFLAILSIASGRIFYGAWLIIAAGLFDALDGFMARLSNTDSQFGIELDSICDIVSFGAAPGLMLFMLGLNKLPFIGIILSALPPLCGAVRLARYNLGAAVKTNYFRGLPIPAQAIMAASFYLTFHDRLNVFDGSHHGVNTILIPLIVILSLLMVSTLPFDKFPRFDPQSLKKYKPRLYLFIIYGILIIVLHEIGLMIVFALFILKGIGLGAWQFWNNRIGEDPDKII
jgi:CDP-diacylglycerol--serine O-phosphatidyltransferase